jgi:hypothetical protein
MESVDRDYGPAQQIVGRERVEILELARREREDPRYTRRLAAEGLLDLAFKPDARTLRDAVE